MRLTAMTRGGGCGCKLGKGALLEALALMPAVGDPSVLVGAEHSGDAAVVRLRDDLALVASVDFFTPVDDDPAAFGRIAALNALSDVFAAGGAPLFALAVAAYPAGDGMGALAEILAAGARAAAEEGCPVVGGHTIDDPEPKYGLAVVGTVDPARMLTNAAGRAGDALVLTKPIGVGTAITAAKRGAAPAEVVAAARAVMCTSNRAAGEAAVAAGARCATDVTGFGLLGHLAEMAAASGVAARLAAGAVPLLPGARALAGAGHLPSGAARNRADTAAIVDGAGALPDDLLGLLCDPQTNGGLLVAIPPDRAGRLEAELARRGVRAARVGRLEDGPPGRVALDLGGSPP